MYVLLVRRSRTIDASSGVYLISELFHTPWTLTGLGVAG